MNKISTCRRLVPALMTLLLLTAPRPAVAAPAPSDGHPSVLVFTGARLIDGTGRPPIDNATLVVEGDHIGGVGPAAVLAYPQDARRIDLHGRTIVPGLINAHGHLGLVVNGENRADGYTRENVRRQLEQYEQYGVTTMLSLGLNRDLVYDVREEQKRGKFPGASVFTAGRGIGVPNGLPPIPVAGDQLYQPATADEARAAVREMAGKHADVVKLWLDDGGGKFPKMKPEVYAAIIDESHRNKLRVAAHVYYLDDAKSLVADGVDVLAHGVRDKPVDRELIDAMKARGVFYVPTFTVEESSFLFAEEPGLVEEAFFRGAVGPDLLKRLQGPEYRIKVKHDLTLGRVKGALATGMKNLKVLSDAGVPIAFGTDSGAFPTRVPGWAEHRELEDMVKAGLTPMEALVAATRGSAALLGASDRGTLEPGKRADFLVVAADPLDDIRNTRRLVSIWHGGREVRPRVPAEGDHPATIPALTR